MTLQQTSTPVAFVYVSDRERAHGFYLGTLDFTLKSADPFGDFIDMGKALMRMTVMADHKGGTHPVLGWDVEDIGAVVRTLRDRGVVFTIYDGMGQDADGVWPAPDGTRVAWFNDPDGNVLSLSQT
jgi:predicted enzyme related to lactoylglutathione lyase